MISFINQKNIFNILLLIWVVSIPFKNALYQGSTIFLIIFFLVYIFKNKDYDNLKILFNKYKDLFIAFSLIILSMTISNILNDVSKTEAWHLQFSYIYRYAFIFIVLIYFYSKDFFSKQMFIIFIFISLGIQGLDGVYQSITGYDIFKHNTGDLTQGLSGALSHRNVFGFFMGFGMLLTFFIIINNHTFDKFRNLGIVLFLFFLFCTLFSYSRAAWVSTFITFLLYFIIYYKNINIKTLYYFLIVLVLLILSFYYMDTLQSRLELLIQANSSYRDLIWSHTIKMIMQKPILGWGLDSWGSIGYAGHVAAHNIILEIILYMGFLGLIFFVFFLIIVIKDILRKQNFQLFFYLAFLLIIGQFDYSLITVKTYLSAMTILMFFVFMNRIDKKEIKK